MKGFILASSLLVTLGSLDLVNARSAKLSPFGLSSSSTSASSFSNGALPEALLNLASVRTSDEGRQLRQKPRRRPTVQQFPTLQKPRRRVQVVNRQNENHNSWPVYNDEDEEFGAENLLRTQGGDIDESLNEVDVYAIDPDNLPEGYVCMNKTYDVSTYEHENQIQCSHVWQKSCFTVQATVFKPVEQDECTDHFEEECTITNEDVARSEKVRRCTQPFRRDCQKEGAEVCTIEYETVCDTKYIANNVTDKIAQCDTVLNDDGIPVRKCKVVEEENVKYSPQVECRQEEQEVCGPEPCPLVKGDEECRETYEQKIISVPVSDCSLTPRTTCSKVTRIVPNLEPQNKCMQVPKEICSVVRVATKQIVEPATKLWCGPSQNSTQPEVSL